MEKHTSGDESLRFLGQCRLFSSLPDDSLRRVVEVSTLKRYGPDSVIFRLDDPADRVYIIKSGVVEICRERPGTSKPEIVAYLGERETMGEMAIFTGTSRESIARVPERAELLVITRRAFMGLLEELPVLAIRLTTIFAERLQAFIMRQRLQIHGQELSGSLEYFDPSTLIQTLAHNDRTGLLTITDRNDATVARIYVEDGKVRAARLGHLKGIEAFYQLFQSVNGKAFTFRVGGFAEMQKDERISDQTIALLVQANRLKDELNKLKGQIPTPGKTFKTQNPELSWSDEATAPLAEEIWNLINRGRSLAHILQRVPISNCLVYKVVFQMLEEGQIV
jgi:CRP-like cAMP-binding protein